MEVEVGGRMNGRGGDRRRRRIVERGSHRLALITGRIHSLNYDHHPNPLPPLFPDHHHPNQNEDPNNNNSLIHHSHTKSFPVFSFNHHQVDDGEQHASTDRGNAFDVGSNNIGELRKCDTNTKPAIQAGGAAAAGAIDSGHKVQQQQQQQQQQQVSHHAMQ